MAIKVKELRELLCQFPDDLSVIVSGSDRTDDFLEIETVKIVKAVPSKFGLKNPDWIAFPTKEDEKNKQDFVFIGD